jgi:hypothetical protein
MGMVSRGQETPASFSGVTRVNPSRHLHSPPPPLPPTSPSLERAAGTKSCARH